MQKRKHLPFKKRGAAQEGCTSGTHDQVSNKRSGGPSSIFAWLPKFVAPTRSSRSDPLEMGGCTSTDKSDVVTSQKGSSLRSMDGALRQEATAMDPTKLESHSLRQEVTAMAPTNPESRTLDETKFDCATATDSVPSSLGSDVRSALKEEAMYVDIPDYAAEWDPDNPDLLASPRGSLPPDGIGCMRCGRDREHAFWLRRAWRWHDCAHE